jgi:hypothetical protein
MHHYLLLRTALPDAVTPRFAVHHPQVHLPSLSALATTSPAAANPTAALPNNSSRLEQADRTADALTTTDARLLILCAFVAAPGSRRDAASGWAAIGASASRLYSHREHWGFVGLTAAATHSDLVFDCSFGCFWLTPASCAAYTWPYGGMNGSELQTLQHAWARTEKNPY